MSQLSNIWGSDSFVKTFETSKQPLFLKTKNKQKKSLRLHVDSCFFHFVLK